MFALKVILELIAITLLIVGYLNEEKVIAFERAVWKKMRAKTASNKTAAAHSATYYASKEAAQREWERKERIAKSAEYARTHAVIRGVDNEPQRVA